MTTYSGVEVGQQFGNYRLVNLLGRGAFAGVYLAEHVHLHTKAAIKVIHTVLSDDDIERFLAEARIIAKFDHEHIVRVLDFDVEEGIPFLVMDYAPAGTLRQRHPQHVPLPPAVILPYVRQVASALQYVHDRLVVHRDVKPENLLVGRRQEVLISDFGIAIAGRNSISQITQNIAGSPAYMAPEQSVGQAVPASDQYALGVVAYEWLTGERPFNGSLQEIAFKHTLVPPPRLHEKVPAIPGAIDEVVGRALAKDRHERFASVQDFADALEEACQSAPYLLPSSIFDLCLPAPRLVSCPVAHPLSASLPPYAPSSVAQIGLECGESSVSPSPLSGWSPSQGQPAPVSGLFQVEASPVKESSHIAAISPDAPVESSTPHPPTWLSHHLTRRKVAALLLGTSIAMSGGADTLLWNSFFHQAHSGAQVPKTIPTPLLQGHSYYTYPGHASNVNAVAWSPRGQRIASGSGDSQTDVDHTVQVWDAASGENALIYRKHTAEVKTVVWSPNGAYIASGSVDKTVRVWDAVTGNDLPFSPYRGHAARVRNVVWSPDGKSLASASKDRTVQVWDAATGRQLFLYPYPDELLTVAWSPDGQYIAFGGFGANPAVEVWDVAHSRLIYRYKNHTGDVRGIAWSRDSKRIASGSYDQTVQIWDAFTGNNAVTCRVHSEVNTLAWSPDSRSIASGSIDHTVQIWDASTGHHVYTYPGAINEVWAVAWSPDSTRIASGSNDHKVRVWKT